MFIILLFLFSTISFIKAPTGANSLDIKPVSSTSATSYGSSATSSGSDKSGSYAASEASSSYSYTSRTDNGNSPSNCNNGILKCGDNEVRDECPSICLSDYCPIAEGQDQRCPIPYPCPPPTCKCKLNHRRALNDTCIPTSECPPFPCLRPNEEYIPCPPSCPTDSCSMATPSGECPLKGDINRNPECRPTCRCKKGYWRNNFNICVPYNQCPGVMV